MPDELHICLMNDSFPPQIDGVANAVVNYATLLPAHGVRTAVATPFYPGTDDSRFPFPVVRFPSLDTTERLGYRTGVPFSPETLAQLRGMDFSLIHSHCPVTSTLLARTLRQSSPMPLILTYHTKFDIDISNAVRSRLLQESAIRLLVENISACDEIWVVSRGAGDNLRSLGFQGECRVMPNGVDLPRGRVGEAEIVAATAGFDLPGGVPVFLFVGRMMWYKGLRITLDALRALSDGGQDYRMVFTGGGGDFEAVRAYAHELGLDGRCFFTGPITRRETIRAWYCRADLFLFPSTFDTNGLVVREAAASALASVLVRGSCAAEDSTDGRNGFLIEENAASMAACLRALCAQPDQMRAAGEAAQQELYMSWDEAVGNACRRYAAVADNYARGLYPAHTAATEELFRGAAGILDSLAKTRRRSRAAQLELERSRRELELQLREREAEFNAAAAQAKAERERLRRRLEAGAERAEQQAEANLARLAAELEKSREKLRERADSLWERMDRFL